MQNCNILGEYANILFKNLQMSFIFITFAVELSPPN